MLDVAAGGGENISNSTLYTGRSLDVETGLYYYRNRYYHAQLGRFVSRDPIGYMGSELNLFEYSSSTPTVYVDPFGLKEWDISINQCEDRRTRIAAFWVNIFTEAFDVDPANPDWTALESFLNGLDEDDSIKNVIFTGHGGKGQAGVINTATIDDEDIREILELLSQKLSDDARVDIRHCNVASGDEGKQFICKLSSLLGADVTAYDDWYAITPHGTEFTAHPDGTIDETAERPDFRDTLLGQFYGGNGTIKPDKPKKDPDKPVKEKPNKNLVP